MLYKDIPYLFLSQLFLWSSVCRQHVPRCACCLMRVATLCTRCCVSWATSRRTWARIRWHALTWLCALHHHCFTWTRRAGTPPRPGKWVELYSGYSVRCCSWSNIYNNNNNNVYVMCRVMSRKNPLGKPDQRDLNENLAATHGLTHMIQECRKLFQVRHFLECLLFWLSSLWVQGIPLFFVRTSSFTIQIILISQEVILEWDTLSLFWFNCLFQRINSLFGDCLFFFT